MKNVSTIFLKIVLFVMTLPIIAICIFLVPELGRFAGDVFASVPGIGWGYMMLFYMSAICYFFALYQTYFLLKRIDAFDAFSERSVVALQRIKACAIAICVVHVLALPIFYAFAELDDAPGVIFVGCIVPFASLAIAVFAAVLERLLQQAIDLKAENDLMI